MKPPVSRLDDADMQAAPAALMRAAERARRLAEQTGTRFVARAAVASLNDGLERTRATEPDGDASASVPASGSIINQA